MDYIYRNWGFMPIMFKCMGELQEVFHREDEERERREHNMNKAVKEVIIFLSGAAVGAVSMYFGVKKYFEFKADMEIAEVRDAYDRHLAEVEDSKSSLDGSIKGESEINEKDIAAEPTKSSIVHALNNKPPLTDYTKYFVEKGNKEELELKEVIRNAKEDASDTTDPAELEGPKDDIPYTEEEDNDQTIEYEGYQLNGEHKKALEEDRKPYTIDPSDYELTCNNYEKLTLLYYISDDVVLDESEEEVNRFDLIGNVIMESGLDENDEEILFVRNDKLMCDYEVVKVFTRYEKG